MIIASLIIFSGCEKENDHKSDILIFPVGRSFLNSSTVDIKVGDQEYQAGYVSDSCGGYWLQIKKSDLSGNDDISITITRKNESPELFSESAGQRADWMNPSYYIDSDNEIIILKAAELTTGITSDIEKALVIQQFVIGHVRMKQYKDSFLDKASETYELGYGTCMNFSRLFVALCRAASIPARTIWGVVYGHNDDSIYDYHHQWAEMMDPDGYWHPLDFNYTTNFNLNDVRYLDLIYAAEENSVVKNRELYDMMIENLNYYNDYPVTLTAHLGFNLISDNRPDSMVVGFKYEM